MIDAQEARRRAQMVVAADPGAFRYEWLSTTLIEGKGSVAYEVFTEEGHSLDGPVVVLVDPGDGTTSVVMGM
jgi:hypothetical protein